MRRTLTVVLVLVALALTACQPVPPEFSANEQVPAEQRTEEGADEGDGAGEDDAPQDVAGTFVGNASLEFTQAPSTLPAGGATIELVVEGGAPHNVVFQGVEGDAPIVEAGGNETATGTVSLEPGSYTFYCSVPGHQQAGMEGTLTVE